MLAPITRADVLRESAEVVFAKRRADDALRDAIQRAQTVDELKPLLELLRR